MVDRLAAFNQPGCAAMILQIPERIECPSQIFKRIADMGHFPIKHSNDVTGPVMKNIAVSEVTMND